MPSRKAETEFAKIRYDGCNILIADAKNGYAIHADERQEVVELKDGLNIIGARNLNDPDDQRVQMARRLLTLQTSRFACQILWRSQVKFSLEHLSGPDVRAWLFEMVTMALSVAR